MLTNLLKSKTIITDSLYLRYDIKTMISCEQEGVNPFKLSYPPPLAYVKAGFGDCFKELGLDETEQAQVISEIVNSISVQKLSEIVLSATINALPPPIIGSKACGTNPDFTKLKGYFVDIMGRSEEEFFNSTIAEVVKRWDDYAIFNGYKKAPQTFCEFED